MNDVWHLEGHHQNLFQFFRRSLVQNFQAQFVFFRERKAVALSTVVQERLAQQLQVN